MKSSIVSRADAVIRWLERMKSAYSSGRVESAYLDAQCASADLEYLRSNIFADIKPKPRTFFPALARTLFLSAAILITMVNPLSYENVPYVHETPAVLPQKAEHSETQKTSQPPAAKTKKPRRASPQKLTPRNEARKPTPKTTPVSTKKQPAYDKMNYLLETGRRALKSDITVIKIK